MKKLILMLLFFYSAPIANAQTKKPADLYFILGRWEMVLVDPVSKIAKGKITESWAKNTNGLSGKSYRHGANGDSVLTETVIIKLIQNDLYYCVTGKEKNNVGTTNFKLISSTNGTYIFENKLHDFPQRVVYQNKGKNNLLAWIEGTLNGKKMKSVFAYHRSK